MHPDLIYPEWPAPKNVHSFTTTRKIWGEEKPIGNNTATNSLVSLAGLPEKPRWVKQVHGNHVVSSLDANQATEADAVFSDKEKHVCAILTADCLPIFICDSQARKVAAIHAGWRGLACGVINETLKHFQQFNPTDLLVWLGPAIGPLKFEVGEDVYNQFTQIDSKYKADFLATQHNKWLANLYSLAKKQFQQHNIQQIYGGNYCTHTDSDRFFSYRRDSGDTGRMASIIYIAGS